MSAAYSAHKNTELMSQRDTISIENAEVLSHLEFDSDQYVLRLQAPQCAKDAQPGTFIHLQCDPSLPLRRPFSIMRTDAKKGWIELLYRVVGNGSRLLSTSTKGDNLNLIGPIGRPFSHDETKSRPILIGGGVGIPPMIFLAEWLKPQLDRLKPIVLMGSEVPFPFKLAPSKLQVKELPDDTISSLALLEKWNIASRLSSQQDYASCFRGYVTELARNYLTNLKKSELGKVEIFACGPIPMLEATARLAVEFDVPCQIAFEEFMPCAVGACAGCTIKVKTGSGIAMKRVCVDGPVFNANSVIF